MLANAESVSMTPLSCCVMFLLMLASLQLNIRVTYSRVSKQAPCVVCNNVSVC